MSAKKISGFTLVELIVVIALIGIVVTAISLQINPLAILGRARDDVRKTDINNIAKAYDIKAVDNNIYEVLTATDMGGKIPTPPEGGQYQGLLTQPQDYYFICAQLEKGKDLNCLLNSENINCYCKKSKNAPTPTPTPGPIFSPTPSPSGIGTSPPGPSPTLTPIPSPSANPTSSATPTPTPTPVSTSSCPASVTKPATVTLSGIDSSWCYDSDYQGPSVGGLVTAKSKGYCMDSSSCKDDYCEDVTAPGTVRDGYCTGTWWGLFWTKVHCDFGGYVCPSWGLMCSQGACTENQTPKRVFVTSTKYNGNLGGLYGADTKCQERANAANLGGIWKAWLSSQTISSSSRLNHSNFPYKLLNGTIIANDWTQLISTDKTIFAPINFSELKTIVNDHVWTNTNDIGGIRNITPENTCFSWTSASSSYGGFVGDSRLTYQIVTWTDPTNTVITHLFNQWTDAQGVGSGYNDYSYCNNSLPLYCFEQ